MIPAGSIDDITCAIRSALNTPVERLQQLGREGRRRVEENHNLKLIAPILFKAFSEK